MKSKLLLAASLGMFGIALPAFAASSVDCGCNIYASDFSHTMSGTTYHVSFSLVKKCPDRCSNDDYCLVATTTTSREHDGTHTSTNSKIYRCGTPQHDVGPPYQAWAPTGSTTQTPHATITDDANTLPDDIGGILDLGTQE